MAGDQGGAGLITAPPLAVGPRQKADGLTAVTSREYGVVDDKITDGTGIETLRRERKLIEPRSVYSVGRVLRNILSDTSSVGLIATSVAREKDLDSLTLGGDATVRRDQNRLFWNARPQLSNLAANAPNTFGNGIQRQPFIVELFR